MVQDLYMWQMRGRMVVSSGVSYIMLTSILLVFGCLITSKSCSIFSWQCQSLEDFLAHWVPTHSDTSPNFFGSGYHLLIWLHPSTLISIGSITTLDTNGISRIQLEYNCMCVQDAITIKQLGIFSSWLLLIFELSRTTQYPIQSLIFCFILILAKAPNNDPRRFLEIQVCCG